MEIQDGDLERVHAPLDFVGINLYTRTFVAENASDPRGIAGAAGDTEHG